MKITHGKTGGVLEVTEEQYDAFAAEGWERAPDDEPTDYELREWHHLQPDYAEPVPTDVLRKRWHDVYDQTPAGAPAAPPSTINPPPPEGDDEAAKKSTKSGKSTQPKE